MEMAFHSYSLKSSHSMLLLYYVKIFIIIYSISVCNSIGIPTYRGIGKFIDHYSNYPLKLHSITSRYRNNSISMCNHTVTNLSHIILLNQTVEPYSNSTEYSITSKSIQKPTIIKLKNHIKALSTLSSSSSSSQSEQMTYMQTMFTGAMSRTIAQTVMHPVNTYKTMLQINRNTVKGIKTTSSQLKSLTMDRLFRGADAQFLLSLPHGAFHFFVIDMVKQALSEYVPKKFDILTDFISSMVSTMVCSVVSTPQMVLTDRLMAGVYPSLPIAIRTILKQEGFRGFYAGWWPALAQKIPSYGLTWVFFQELKRTHERIFKTKVTGDTSFVLGAVAAAASVVVMIPMDTVKTRLVIQLPDATNRYLGVTNAFYRIFREEGISAFYSSLPPRLFSVVPMIAIQYGVYEAIKIEILKQRRRRRLAMKQKTHPST